MANSVPGFIEDQTMTLSLLQAELKELEVERQKLMTRRSELEIAIRALQASLRVLKDFLPAAEMVAIPLPAEAESGAEP